MKSSGKLTHRVRFEARTAGQDSMGQVSSTWTEVFTCWGQVEGLKASYTTTEEFREKQFSPEGLFQVTIRNTPRTDALTEKHRIVYAGRTLDIMRIVPGERRMDDKILYCKERVFVEGDAQ